MNNKQQAAADLRRFGQMLRGVIGLADELDKVGSLEAAATDAEQRLYKAKIELVTVEKQLGVLKDRADESRALVDSSAKDAKVRADEIIADAEKRATGLVEAARTTVTKMKQDATLSARRALDDTNATIQKMDSEIQRKIMKNSELNGDIALAESRLAELNAKIEEVKNHFNRV